MSSNKANACRFSTMMAIDGKRSYQRLNAAIQFTTPLTSNIDEAVVDADGYTVSLDDDSLRILFHKSTFPEFDLDKFTSIILKVASALYGQRDDECADDPYEVYDYLNDTYTPIYVSLPVSLIDPNFETDSSESDDDSDDNSYGSDDDDQQSNPDTQVAYLYSIDIPLCDWKAYQRIANAIGVPNAFPRKRKDDFDSHKSNNYGSYIAPKYSIFLDGDMAFIQFKDLDLEFIASIMNPICDALLIKRGDYEICDVETGDPIDPSTVTLKNVLALSDGLITPSKKPSQDKPWRPSDSLSDKEKLFWNDYEFGPEQIKRLSFNNPTLDSTQIKDLAREEDLLDKLQRGFITPLKYAQSVVPSSSVPTYSNYTSELVAFFRTFYYYINAYNTNKFDIETQLKYLIDLFDYISLNIQVLYHNYPLDKIGLRNKLIDTITKKIDEFCLVAISKKDIPTLSQSASLLHDTLTRTHNIIIQLSTSAI